MMGRRAGKMPRGICSVCRKDTALRADNAVFRHPDTYRTMEVCRGSGEKPSHIYDEQHETFVRLDVYLEGNTEKRDDKIRVSKGLDTVDDDMMLLGREYPVLNEHGIVVGRARIECGHIRILGPKWVAKSA